MIKRLAILSLLPLLLSTGCLFDDSDGPSEQPPQLQYHAYTDPDSLVANLVLAWENRDIAEYRDHILYDGEELATDGSAYEPFHFYNDPAGEDPGQTFPAFEIYDREVECVGNMFAGLKGQDHMGNEIPGIRSIAMGLFAESDWDAPPGGMVEGHVYPDGTLRRFYGTNFLFTLESTIGNSNIIAWEVQDRLLIHVIPVETADGIEYRVWKWRDIITQLLPTADAALSSIKALY
jgi:hypothetical protein